MPKKKIVEIGVNDLANILKKRRTKQLSSSGVRQPRWEVKFLEFQGAFKSKQFRGAIDLNYEFIKTKIDDSEKQWAYDYLQDFNSHTKNNSDRVPLKYGTGDHPGPFATPEKIDAYRKQRLASSTKELQDSIKDIMAREAVNSYVSFKSKVDTYIDVIKSKLKPHDDNEKKVLDAKVDRLQQYLTKDKVPAQGTLNTGDGGKKIANPYFNFFYALSNKYLFASDQLPTLNDDFWFWSQNWTSALNGTTYKLRGDDKPELKRQYFDPAPNRKNKYYSFNCSTRAIGLKRRFHLFFFADTGNAIPNQIVVGEKIYISDKFKGGEKTSPEDLGKTAGIIAYGSLTWDDNNDCWTG